MDPASIETERRLRSRTSTMTPRIPTTSSSTALPLPSVSQTEKELMVADKSGTWPTFYKKIVESSVAACHASGLTNRVASFPMHAPYNRYKDVLPWDQTRVKLTGNGAMDYINADHVSAELAGCKVRDGHCFFLAPSLGARRSPYLPCSPSTISSKIVRP